MEGGGVAVDLPQVDPVADEGAGDGDHHGEDDAGADGGGAGEVEPENPDTVAPHDQQTELAAAVQAVAFPPRIRPGDTAGPRACQRFGFRGFKHPPVAAVNQGFLTAPLGEHGASFGKRRAESEGWTIKHLPP